MLKLYDSLAKKKRVFKPFVKGRVGMYNCGPTVYDYIHIGNLRAFLFADFLRRWLEAGGLQVEQVMNITDVGHMLADADTGEDKIETAAAKSGMTPVEVAKFYTEAFFKDIERLGIRRASVYPKASEHVPEMVAMISKLLENGHAYKVEEPDGGVSVYYDVASFPAYGRLSGNSIEGLEPGARVDIRKEKKHPADFALWIHNPKHLMQWEAPWGLGYPGWHIECSAMSTKYLGPTLDIHTGGEDNKFPHHECEIAQSEGATGATYARYWLHVTHLMVEGEKMSKSKGNFFTLDDLLAKGFRAREIRYLLLSTHYRQQLNFTMAGIESAKGALSRLDSFADAVRDFTPKDKARSSPLAKKTFAAFAAAMDDDLNVAEALSAVFEFVREANEAMSAGRFTVKDREEALRFVSEFGSVFGLALGSAVDDPDIPQSVLVLIEKRDEARRDKRFAESDRLRDEIRVMGYVVEDTPDGRRIKRI
jgi:cysteinyl-tRNA synthetase